MDDNLSEALKMAGSVLLFVLALSITIPAITQNRIAVDKVIAYSDRETYTIKNDSNYYYLGDSNNLSRTVGISTIIPSIYRAYKENYKIVFEFPDDYYIYELEVLGKRNVIDLENEPSIPQNGEEEFINGILYHKFESSKEAFIKKFALKGLNVMSLYDKMKSLENCTIKEYLGTYYMEDTGEGTTEEDVNKQEKRVITYKFIN